MTFLLASPSAFDRSLLDADGVTGLQLNNGTPRPVNIDTITALLAISGTPTGTTGTFGLEDGIVSSSNFTRRADKGVGAGFDTALPFHVRAWARRKPGTTGAIVAQTVILKNQAASVELARFEVLAAAAGEEPVSGWIDKPFPAGDTRWTLGNTETLAFAVTAVDTDLEIVLEIYGQE